MASVYTPDDSNNPDTMQVPDDGDDLTVGSILPAIEAALDLAHDSAQKSEDNVFAGEQTFSGPVTFNNTEDHNAAVQFDDTVTFNDPVTFGAGNGSATFNYKASFTDEVAWEHGAGANSDMNINGDTQVWIQPPFTGDHIWTLVHSGPPTSGARTRVVKLQSAHALTLKDATGPTTVATVPAGQIGWVDFDYNGSNWIPTAWGGGTTVP